MALNKILSKKINTKIVEFFNANRFSIETARGIAGWIGEDLKEVIKALKILIKAKILKMHKSGLTTAYSYTHDQRFINKIDNALKKKEKK